MLAILASSDGPSSANRMSPYLGHINGLNRGSASQQVHRGRLSDFSRVDWVLHHQKTGRHSSGEDLKVVFTASMKVKPAKSWLWTSWARKRAETWDREMGSTLV